MSKKYPVIGIVPSLNPGTMHPHGAPIWYLRRTYTDVLKNVGAIPVMVTPDMPVGAVLALCGGVVISGGEDINPSLYGKDRLESKDFGLEPIERSEWELQLIRECEALNMPILGICYGMQLINVCYGGTLTQDIASERPWSDNHWLTEHQVHFDQDYLGFEAGAVKSIESRHHQAVDVLGEGVEVCATAPDGTVEAIRRGNSWGMQWHPESDLTGVHVYRAFVEQCMPALESTDESLEMPE